MPIFAKRSNLNITTTIYYYYYYYYIVVVVVVRCVAT